MLQNKSKNPAGSSAWRRCLASTAGWSRWGRWLAIRTDVLRFVKRFTFLVYSNIRVWKLQETHKFLAWHTIDDWMLQFIEIWIQFWVINLSRQFMCIHLAIIKNEGIEHKNFKWTFKSHNMDNPLKMLFFVPNPTLNNYRQNLYWKVLSQWH